MWGYNCGAAVTGSTATCAALNPHATGAWSPVVITVPTGAAGGLTINLTNSLSFLNGNTLPTSMTIVGQVGGGLGSARTTTLSPDHTALSSNSVSWPVANTGATFTPPPQGPRVQSFATEVAAGTTTALTWAVLKPGTYLIESGTHPSIQGPMGLYGILVVTAAPTATTTTPITETAAGCAYYTPGSTTVCAIPYDAEVPMLLSEIDPVQNTTVSAAVNTAGFSETAVWSGQPGGCGNPASTTYLTCYPPAVNYTPTYYMINGVAFDKNNASGSVFPITPATLASPPTTSATGSVLVRVVNAGLKMHVPAIVGSQVAGATGGTNPIVTGFKVIAEDGNPLPGVPKVKSEVFMAAGKTYDLMINGQSTPASGARRIREGSRFLRPRTEPVGECDCARLRHAGLHQHQWCWSAGSFGTAPVAVPAVAVADTYVLVPGQILTVSDPSKGVIANDHGVYLAQVLVPPANGTVTMSPIGTFAYYPNAGSTATTDTFTYCANGDVKAGVCSSGISATVTLGPSTIADTGITCTAATFTANMATYLAIKTPGVLAACKDAANLPLTVNPLSVISLGCDGSCGRERRVHRHRARRGHLQFHGSGAELPEHTDRDHDRDGHLPRGKQPGGHRAGRLRQDDDDLRLSVDHRGRSHLLCQPGLLDESSALGLPDSSFGDRSNPGHQFPHQQHAVCGAGLHRAGVVRRRPDSV